MGDQVRLDLMVLDDHDPTMNFYDDDGADTYNNDEDGRYDSDNSDNVVSKTNSIDGLMTGNTNTDEMTTRQRRKAAKKAMKAARREKRQGGAVEASRKPCDLCGTPVDMLIRCTVDATQQYRMVCGKCWPSVSGGVPDGDDDHPHYNYGGVWKNRAANQKKRIGSG